MYQMICSDTDRRRHEEPTDHRRPRPRRRCQRRDRQSHPRRLGVGAPAGRCSAFRRRPARSASTEWVPSKRAREESMPQLSPRLPAAAVAPRTVPADRARRSGRRHARRRDDEIEPVIEFVDRLDPEHIAERLMAPRRRVRRGVRDRGGSSAGRARRSRRSRPGASRSSPTSPISPLQTAPATSAPTTGSSGGPRPGSSPRPPTAPGRVAVFIGNHRYQCQDISDASFRSYVRENASHLTVEDSRPTHEDPKEAHRIVSGLLAEHG